MENGTLNYGLEVQPKTQRKKNNRPAYRTGRHDVKTSSRSRHRTTEFLLSDLGVLPACSTRHRPAGRAVKIFSLEFSSVRLVVVALMMASFSACERNELVVDPQVNSPTYASTINAFSYNVNARDFGADVSVPVSFTTDSIAFALSVTKYGGGSGSITVKTDSLLFRSSDLTTNMSVATTLSLRSAPDTVRVKLSRFTGMVSLAIGGIQRHESASIITQ